MSKKLVFGFLLFLVLFVMALPVKSQTNTFVIEYADTVGTLSFTSSPNLFDLISNVAPRFVIEYANNKNEFPIQPAPPDLMALITSVSSRYVVEYANGLNYFPVSYPAEMIQDKTAPPVLGDQVTFSDNNLTQIQVATSEYTTAVLRFGSAPGNYSQVVEDNLFRYVHTFSFSDLSPGETYFYTFTFTDRSGNTAQTPENQFLVKVIKNVYLPRLRR